MKTKIIVTTFVLTLTACGQPSTFDTEEQVAPPGMTEEQLNAPVDETDGLTPETSADPESVTQVKPSARQTYFFPTYSSRMVVRSSVFDQAKRYYDQYWSTFGNSRYAVVIDMGLHSGKKRFVLIDLKTGSYEVHNTSHGTGSDTNNDGYAEAFSNTSGSKKTSLGAYKTLYTYNGNNGRSLRLEGLASTNSNALSRAIVVHGADYVKDSSSRAGRSWGCPALDHAIAQTVIDKIKGGAMLFIGK